MVRRWVSIYPARLFADRWPDMPLLRSLTYFPYTVCYKHGAPTELLGNPYIADTRHNWTAVPAFVVSKS